MRTPWFADAYRLGLLALLLATIVIGSTSCAGRRAISHAETWGPFRGRFIDVDTGQPIRGGLAYAVWYRIVPTPVQSNQEFYAMQFGITNDVGEYEIPALPYPPVVSSFYDGPFRSSIVPGHQLMEVTENASYTVSKWRPFSRIPEAQRRYGGALYTGSIPEEKRHEMLRQINAIRAQMGLPPFRSLGGAL